MQRAGDSVKYNVVYLDTAEIKPYRMNAKKHPQEQINQIAESIRQFGFRQNLVVDSNNVLVIGHGRLLAENCFLSTKKEEHYALCL